MIGSTSSERFYPAAGNCARRDDGRAAGDDGRLAFMLHPQRCGALVLAAMFDCPACGAVGSDPVLLQRFEDLRTRDDLDGMVKRRFVRALVVYSKTSTSSTAVAAAGWSPRACKPSWRISIDR